jgi:hypothetical protein
LEKLKQIIDDLKTMQRIDYSPDGYGYIILDDAIELLTMVHDSEACASSPGLFADKECND